MRRIMRLEGDIAYLVGFPRSGNHYVSVCLEKYTDNRSPISNYRGLAGRSLTVYRIHAGEFRGTHDLKMDARFRKVVFLYRNPVDTLYSYCRYEGIRPNMERIRQEADFWARHTMKWMFTEGHSRRKVILCYERLLADFCREFGRLLDFFGLGKDAERMRQIRQSTTKEEIKALVDRKDNKVINVTEEYRVGKAEFVKEFGQIIVERVPLQISEVLDRDALETEEGSYWKLRTENEGD
jgi:hypothetical protein